MWRNIFQWKSLSHLQQMNLCPNKGGKTHLQRYYILTSTSSLSHFTQIFYENLSENDLMPFKKTELYWMFICNKLLICHHIMQGKVMRAHAFSILFPFFACAVYLVSCASFNAYSMIHNIFNVEMDMHIASAIQIELPWTSPIESKFCKCNYRNHRIIK